ncbi:apolipoprotein N-acyltransferase [Nonomuraea sp. NPDC050556]|uniref:apolipoprotein N-acyltransferase n=1 Tax=Nonomuraea sp. NPDC050556 TaxID=3364369 RepID=UPI00379A0DE8
MRRTPVVVQEQTGIPPLGNPTTPTDDTPDPAAATSPASAPVGAAPPKDASPDAAPAKDASLGGPPPNGALDASRDASLDAVSPGDVALMDASLDGTPSDGTPSDGALDAEVASKDVFPDGAPSDGMPSDGALGAGAATTETPLGDLAPNDVAASNDSAPNHAFPDGAIAPSEGAVAGGETSLGGLPGGGGAVPGGVTARATSPGRESRAKLLGRIVAAAAGGLLLYLAFPPLDWWWCAPLGITLIVISLYGCRPRRAAWLGYLAAAVFLFPTLSWVRPIGDDAWVGLVAVSSLFYAAMAACAAPVFRLRWWPVWFGALWVAMEWGRSVFPVGGFPWARVAFSQGESAFTSYAALGGAPLVSFAVTLSGALLAMAVLRLLQAPQPIRVSRKTPQTSPVIGATEAAKGDGEVSAATAGLAGADAGVTGGLAGAAGLAGAGAAAGLAGAGAAAGHAGAGATAGHATAGDATGGHAGAGLVGAGGAAGWAWHAVVPAGLALVVPLLALAVPRPGDEGRNVNVGIVQGNVPGEGMYALGEEPAVVLNNHARETHALAQAARDGKLLKPDIVVLPENSTDIDPYRDAFARDTIDASVKDVGVPTLVGAVVAIGDQHRATRSLVWDPATGPGAYYDKQQLVPFGEFTPFQDLVLALFERARLVGRQSVPGTKDGTLRMGPVTIGAVNCYEVAFDGIVRGTVKAGGTPLVVQTNNATYALTNLPPQQLAMSKLRAVEHNRAVVTAATTGISAYVTPDGKVAWQTKERVADMNVVKVPVRTEATIATQVGQAPEWALILVGAAAVGAAAWRGRRRDESVRND